MAYKFFISFINQVLIKFVKFLKKLIRYFSDNKDPNNRELASKEFLIEEFFDSKLALILFEWIRTWYWRTLILELHGVSEDWPWLVIGFILFLESEFAFYPDNSRLLLVLLVLYLFYFILIMLCLGLMLVNYCYLLFDWSLLLLFLFICRIDVLLILLLLLLYFNLRICHTILTWCLIHSQLGNSFILSPLYIITLNILVIDILLTGFIFGRL